MSISLTLPRLKLVGFQTVPRSTSRGLSLASIFNAHVAYRWAIVQPFLDAYNAALDEANDWRQGIALAIQETLDERSETWQESEPGQALTHWQQQWEREPLESI